MRHPSCFLLEARTEELQDESDVNVDEFSYEREWDEKSSESPVHCAQTIAAKDSAPGGAVGMISNRQRRLNPG